MPRKTVLQLVNDVLPPLGHEEVSSISESPEAVQIAWIARDCYEEMVDEMELSHKGELVKLESASDPDNPTLLKIPDQVSRVEWINYSSEIIERLVPEVPQAQEWQVIINSNVDDSGCTVGGGDSYPLAMEFMASPLFELWTSGDPSVESITILDDGNSRVLRNYSDTGGSGYLYGEYFSYVKPALLIIVYRSGVTINLQSSRLSILAYNNQGGPLPPYEFCGPNANGAAVILLNGSGSSLTDVTLNIYNTDGSNSGWIVGGYEGLTPGIAKAVFRIDCAGETNVISGASQIIGSIDG